MEYLNKELAASILQSEEEVRGQAGLVISSYNTMGWRCPERLVHSNVQPGLIISNQPSTFTR